MGWLCVIAVMYSWNVSETMIPHWVRTPEQCYMLFRSQYAMTGGKARIVFLERKSDW